MIHVRGLRKDYLEGNGERVKVLDGVDLEAGAGEFVAIVGASGSGKSTLLHILGGLDTDWEGEVRVAEQNLRGLSDAGLSRLRNEQVGFVFQSFHLVPGLSALENVRLPAHFRAGMSVKEEETRAREALSRVGLAGKEARPPSRLSGGERQRVSIARALFCRPRVLLCDEPTGNLDPQTAEGIISLFHSLVADGLTLLVVTHEDRLRAAAGRALRLTDGVLKEEGVVRA
ncbi:MAG TPA: ABC transporter ATP-binding protein [Myxococcaceae bacterium]|nr:ABC transporter ATP-binding protein [Myxococcaceae bacterium]